MRRMRAADGGAAKRREAMRRVKAKAKSGEMGGGSKRCATGMVCGAAHMRRIRCASDAVRKQKLMERVGRMTGGRRGGPEAERTGQQSGRQITYGHSKCEVKR